MRFGFRVCADTGIVFFSVEGSAFLSLLRNPVPSLFEHAQLPVVEEIRPLLAALPESRTVLIPDDLLLLLQQGCEPVHRGLQSGQLFHECVKCLLGHGYLLHIARRLPARSYTCIIRQRGGNSFWFFAFSED